MVMGALEARHAQGPKSYFSKSDETKVLIRTERVSDRTTSARESSDRCQYCISKNDTVGSKWYEVRNVAFWVVLGTLR